MMQNLQLGCGCRGSVCSPVTCDHVYLFGNDFEDAKDIYGKSMRCRFPYDDKERIILEVILAVSLYSSEDIVVNLDLVTT